MATKTEAPKINNITAESHKLKVEFYDIRFRREATTRNITRDWPTENEQNRKNMAEIQVDFGSNESTPGTSVGRRDGNGAPSGTQSAERWIQLIRF